MHELRGALKAAVSPNPNPNPNPIPNPNPNPNHNPNPNPNPTPHPNQVGARDEAQLRLLHRFARGLRFFLNVEVRP